MKRKIWGTLFVVLLCLLVVMPVGATEEVTVSRLVDGADLLKDSEKVELLEELNRVSEEYKCDVVIVTVNSLEGKSVTEYADEFYDNKGYGMGAEADGIIFLISMENRDWAISTHGFAIKAFTDAGQKYIIDDIMPDLSEGRYKQAFSKFISNSHDFLRQAKEAKPYDTGNMPKGTVSPIWIPGSLIIGMAIAFIVTRNMKSKLKSVYFQSSAASYVKAGSMDIKTSHDRFLYSKIDKTEKAKEESSSGSSTHTSSSGNTHGGSSGKF